MLHPGGLPDPSERVRARDVRRRRLRDRERTLWPAHRRPNRDQTAGDCQQRVCDGAGDAESVSDDADVPDDGQDCTEDGCQDGTPTHDPAAGACDEDGGAVCADPAGPKAGTCVECNVDADCTGSDVCDPAMMSNTCVDPSCADGVLNGDETDVDCGGTCAPCANTDDCLVASDCASGFCNANVCSPCGGDQDCAANEFCDPSVNGGTCVDDLTGGAPCNDAAECGTGFCVDGFCCDTLCDGLCDACSAALKGSGSDGTCEPIASGSDPNDECGSANPSTCGQTGSCDGASACELHPAMTPCAAPTCNAGTAAAVDLCDGSGSCVDGGTASCGFFSCNVAGTGCNTTCTTDPECAGNAYCDAGVCVAKLTDGASCIASNQCANGNCVDGTCCNTACGGTCEACNLVGSVGTCTDIGVNLDPANECANAYACNGNGNCQACGDGALQAGEACDDGNLVNNDGCESNCALPNPYVACVNPNLAITGAGPGVANPSSLTIPALPGPITDVNFTTNISHTWPGDLDVRLIHLGVTRFMLDNPGVPASTFGCATDNIVVTLDDEAAAGTVENVCNAQPPGISGTRIPNETLVAFDGMVAAGTWSVVIDDSFAGGDNGTLNQWCVAISY